MKRLKTAKMKPFIVSNREESDGFRCLVVK